MNRLDTVVEVIDAVGGVELCFDYPVRDFKAELDAGANYIHNIDFRTSELRKHADQARALALEAAFEKAKDLAQHAAANLPLTNFAICSAISHMQNMSGLDAAYAESVVAGIVNTQPASKGRLEAFANKTAARVRPE